LVFELRYGICNLLSAYAEDHGLCPWTPSAIAYGVGRWARERCLC